MNEYIKQFNSYKEKIYCKEKGIDYEELALKRELNSYKKFLQTSNFDFIEKCLEQRNRKEDNNHILKLCINR